MSQRPVIHVHGEITLGEGREYGDVWIEDGRISLTRPSGLTADMDRIDGYAFPGLVDVHCHIGLAADGAVTDTEAQDQAIADRDSGVLLVRDAGSPLDTSWVAGRPDLPRLIRAGRHIARPKRYLRGFGDELEDVEQLPDAVAREATRGDGWVKVVADWIDRDHGDLTPLWPDDLLAEAVRRAHANAARMTVHTFSTEAVGAALAAGVDCIEHGTGMTADHIAEAAVRGVPVTPTLLQVAQFEQIAAQADGRFPAFAARMRAMHVRRYEQVRQMYEAGVRILVGTDAGGTIEHGQIARECAELVAAGVPAADVVAAASWRTRAYLGAGEVVEGASADLVVYAEDPRTDIDVLRSPHAVILRGVRYTQA
ncbi:amidohydrolase family protein [Sanguibacter antarcticus]|uniref:Imidazolonepropionase-like amidohydrolase n=1 Tax=Sanguibacter antarcticus TaxID=372484 RepID=A0A2A9E5Q2_9MICO|nr:amidohydrolase family protein [Sanguibacter antarcticus]PFG33562.1 imidazolonepropionase-like amidohydrolase [Sanguibacter antarcticus]